jgi:hypothetical protein
MDYLNNLINYSIKELPDQVINWIMAKTLAFFWWLVHLPVWIKSLVLGVIILISVGIVFLVIKYRDEWRYVY